MTLPSFLLVGAAKTGTTSLMSMIAHHPQVAVAPVKECHHFLFPARPAAYRGPGDDKLNRAVVSDPDAYEALFAHARGARAVGEASVFYLAHPDSFALMASRLDRPRVVAVLRDPVERAVSAYGHLRRDGREPAATLQEGLAAEDARRGDGWEPMWEYARLGRYAEPVEALFDVFGRDRVLLLRHEDLRARSAPTVARVLRFLGVDDTVSLPVRLENLSGQRRSALLHRAMSGDSGPKRLIRAVTPERARQRVFDSLQRHNLRRLPAPDARVLDELAAALAPDTRRLARVSGLDVAHWARRGAALQPGLAR